MIITFAIHFSSNVRFPKQLYGILRLLSTADNYLLVPGSAPLKPNRAHHTKHVYGNENKILANTQPAFACSNPTLETPKQCEKYV